MTAKDSSLRLVAPLAVLLATACTQRDASTQITVAIISETEIPKELNQLEVVVTAADGSEVNKVLHEVNNPRFFPATLALIPRNERSLEGPVRIELRGAIDGKTTQVFRRAIVSYVEGRTLLVPMPLRMACFAFGACGENDTCSGGTCQPALVSTSALVDYRDDLVFGNLPSSGCFDELRCLAQSKPLLVSPEECTFALPPDAVADGGLPRANVSIRWKAAEDRIIVLDADDPIEGWTWVTSGADAGKGKLSPGVCQSLRDQETDITKRAVPDKALDARVSFACPAKRPLQPYCPSADGHVAIGTRISN